MAKPGGSGVIDEHFAGAVRTRTQAERTAATRAALLDATIECLVERGYSGTTTRAIAGRAGVTVGAQQHHFPSKELLVVEALRHLAGRLVAEVLSDGLLEIRDERQRAEAALDRLWEVHRGPLFVAAMELWIAARTDEGLGRSLAEVADEITGSVELAARSIFPGAGRSRRFRSDLVTGLATLRGLAMEAFVPGGPDPDADWPAARRSLLRMLDGGA